MRQVRHQPVRFGGRYRTTRVYNFSFSLSLRDMICARNFSVLDQASNDADVSIVPPIIPDSGFSPVRLEGRHIRRGLPGDYECVASYGLRPSFVHPRRLKRLILVLSRGTQCAGAPPFKRLPALPQGPSFRSGL